MSSTNRGRSKVEQDAYMTPLRSIEPLMNALSDRAEGSRDYGFLEPCRGTGNIYNSVNAAWKRHAEISEGIDYLTTPFADVDFIITNPPFSQALQFLKKSLSEADTVIYLLRLNFLGSQSRRSFWQENRPSHVLTLSERPAFIKVCKGRTVAGVREKGCKSTYPTDFMGNCHHCGGNVSKQTDSIEYAWFCWDRLGIVDLPEGVHVL